MTVPGNPPDAIVALITAPSIETARQIAHTLVGQHLAACANILKPIQSIYFWEGEVHEEEEVLLVVKTRQALFPQIQPAVQAVHPYQVPEIIALPVVDGLPAYLRWIQAVTIPDFPA